MAIDPTTTTTIRVGELGSAAFNTTDLVPHEVSGVLKKGTLEDLATFIGSIIDVTGAIGFRAVQVNDGETLPATDEQEFILVGPGTYPNVGGGSTITTTGSLNALVSNGTFWFIGVEIPIEVNGIWGDITGVLSDQTDLNDILEAKADLVDGKVPNSQLPSYVDDVVEVATIGALPAIGETGKIYVTIDTGNVYRWSGSAYIRIADESPVWGIITGTLSNQTDLQNALNAKFDDPTGDTTQYIAGDGSLITFPVAGQSGTLVRQVKNTTGSTLTKGTVVYINGASGNKPTVTKAIATGDSTSAQTFGLIQADIANNATGYVVCVGDIIGLNTSAYTEGNQLYLSSTTAGGYTTTKQLAPAHLVYIGVVTRSHPTQGQIEVKIQNGYELDEIHDVAISSVANNEVLVYESSSSLWKNKTLSTILGATPITGSGTTNYISKFTGTSALGNSLIYDNGTNIGIGTTSPSAKLSVSDAITYGIYGPNKAVINAINTTTDGTAGFISLVGHSGNASNPYVWGGIGGGKMTAVGNGEYGGYLSLWTTSNGENGQTASASYERMRITSGGNVGIGTTSPTNGKLVVKDSGYQYIAEPTDTATYGYLGIGHFTNGTFIGTTSGSNSASDLLRFGTSGSERMRITSGGSVGIGTTSPSQKLDVGGNILANGGYGEGFRLNDNSSITREAEGMSFNTLNNRRLLISAGGNVGIGTSNPTQLLHIEKDQNTYTNLRIRNNDTGSSAYTMIGLNSSGNSWGIRMGSSAANSNRLDFVIDAFGTPVERMSIRSNGVVNIGSTPYYSNNAAALAGGLTYGDLYYSVTNDGDGIVKIVINLS